MPLGWGKGSKSRTSYYFYFFLLLIFSFMESFVIEEKVLFRVDFLSVTWDHRVHRVGLGVKI